VKAGLEARIFDLLIHPVSLPAAPLVTDAVPSNTFPQGQTLDNTLKMLES
jgi:hypothetical protein